MLSKSSLRGYSYWLRGLLCDFAWKQLSSKALAVGAGTLATGVPAEELVGEPEWQWLRSQLIALPTWRNGHKYLVDLALDRRQVDWAYGSALAMQKLSKKPISKAESDLYLARCLLAAGDYLRALSVVQAISQVVPERLLWRVMSCQAAALIALGRGAEAASIIADIPQAHRDPGDELVLRAIVTSPRPEKPNNS
jgi:hypothetical protein